MTNYENTHILFKIKHTSTGLWGSEEIELCKEYLGDTDPNQLLHLRKWFSSYDGVYVRKDCISNKLMTWFALKAEA